MGKLFSFIIIDKTLEIGNFTGFFNFEFVEFKWIVVALQKPLNIISSVGELMSGYDI